MIIMVFLRKYGYLFLLFCITFSLLFIYKFPDISAYINTPKDMVFLGQNPWFDWFDVNVYVSAIRYGQAGHILMSNLYTSIANQPVLIYPIYTTLGFLFRMGDPFLIFFIASIFTSTVVVVGFYFILRKVGLSVNLSLFSCIAICLGGGFGFLFKNAADITQAITFYDTFLKPHEAIAMLSYTLSLAMFYKVFIQHDSGNYNRKALLIICGSLVIAMIMYSYLIVAYFFITFGFLFFNNKGRLTGKDYFSLAVIYIPAGIIVLIMADQFYTNRTFNVLTQHLNMDLLTLLLGYGVLMPIIFYQIIFLKKSQLEKYLIWWIFVGLFLAFLPFGPGKIFIRGLFFPLILDSVLAIQTTLKNLHIDNRVFRIGIFGIFILLACGTSIFIFSSRMRNPSTQTTESRKIYMPENDYKVFNYLNTKTPVMSNVLGGYLLSSEIPAFTHNTVYVGIPSDTSEYSAQVQAVYTFYAGRFTRSEVVNFLKSNNITYVIWGPEEKDITMKYYPRKVMSLSARYKELNFLYKTGDIEIYATNQLDLTH